MEKENIYLVNDLGYGFIKALALHPKDGRLVTLNQILMPSVFAVEREQDMSDPETFRSDKELEDYVDNIFEHLDVVVQSPSIKDANRVLIGQNAINSHLDLTSFDVYDLNGKAQDQNSIRLTLSTIAGQAVKQYFSKHHEIPDEIDANVKMVTALPPLEGKQNDLLNFYSNLYLKHNHLVILHNFSKLVTVKIHFNKNSLIVALEGEAAQYEIMSGTSKELTKSIKEDFDKNYPDKAADISGEDLIGMQNTLGIDVGEGTTDLAVFTNSRVNELASTSLQVGYGNTLEAAIDDMRSKQMNFQSRAELNSFLKDKPNKLNEYRHNFVNKAVYAQLDQFANRIVSAMSKVLNANSSAIDIIYVYGGGSIPVKDILRPKIVEKTRSFNGQQEIPVIFIDKPYAQYLNEAGLQIIMQKNFS